MNSCNPSAPVPFIPSASDLLPLFWGQGTPLLRGIVPVSDTLRASALATMAISSTSTTSSVSTATALRLALGNPTYLSVTNIGLGLIGGIYVKHLGHMIDGRIKITFQ